MMRSIRASLVTTVLVVALAIPLHAQGQPATPPPAAAVVALSAAERAELVRQAQAAAAMIDDLNGLMRVMPPEIYKVFDRSTFEQQARASIAKLKALGFRLEKAEFGEPTAPHRVGRAIICFLPNTLLMRIGDRMFRTRGYFLAVRADGGDWKFLDGAGLDKHHDWLWTMFPEMPRDIQFPEVKQEMLKP